jgi:antitoxin component HigA of HigAB toxin-antitoxin module
MEDPTATHPSDGQQALTVDQIKALLSEFRGEIQTDLTKQVNGLAKSTKAQMAQIQKQQEDQSRELAKLFAPATDDSATTTETNTPEAPPDPIAAVRSQLERERRDREKELAALRSEMEATKQEAARLQATKEFMAVAGDRAYDPEGLAILAEHRGLLKQEGGRYLALVGQDEFSGEPLYKPLADGFGKLLDKFPNYAKPRPGDGTGATAGESATPSTPRYTNPQQIMDAVMQSPDGGLSVLRDIKSS